MSKFWSSTDSKWARLDVTFWQHELSAALERYKKTSAVTPEDRNAKAAVLSELTCLGHAMVAHFGTGVSTLVPVSGTASPAEMACVEPGLAILKKVDTYAGKMEAMVERTLN